MNKETGVYIIENINTNKCYIGSTIVSFSGRFRDHLGELRRNSHHSKKLQRSFNKHGESAFKFKVIEFCEPELARSLKSGKVYKGYTFNKIKNKDINNDYKR